MREPEAGSDRAADHLFALVYDELKRIARRQLGGGPNLATLNTTALVHEAYLKLGGDARWTAHNRMHFFALAARAMRMIIIDHARERSRVKRGGRNKPISLEDLEIPVDRPADELLAVDRALTRLEALDPDLARLVEWKFFCGLSVDEIAELLAVSERTVKRYWRAARAFLYQELADEVLAQ